MNRLRTDKILSYGIYILSLLIFGTNGLYAARISLSGSQIVFLRTLIGGSMLTCLVLVRGGFDWNSIRKDLPFLLLGGSALGLNWVALFEAYQLLNVSLATLIYYVGPVIVLLLSPLLFRERLTGRKALSVVIVALGLICISGSIAVAGTNPAGLLAAAASALLYASLIVLNKRITHTGGMQTAAIELAAAFVIVLVYVLCTAGLPRIAGSDWPYIWGLGLVNTGLAYLLYFTGLQRLSGQSVALISYLDPVSALIFSALFLHETMTPIQLFGAVLMMGGALLAEVKGQ